MRRLLRRSAVLVGATALAVGVLAPPARADVTISPTEAVQGDAVDLTFDVTEDQPGAYMNKVELVLPENAQVAEVDPMSVPDWAPKVSYTQAHAQSQTQGTPAHGHSGGGTVTSSITWYRVVKPSSPAAASQLRVSMGPLPRIDTLAFTVVQTYSNGKVRVVPPGSGPVLTLRPASAAAPDADSAQHHAAVALQPSAGSSSAWPLALGLVGGVAFGLLLALFTLGRRRRTPTEEAPLDEVLAVAPERDRTTSDA